MGLRAIGDFHTHTAHSHGKGSVADNVRAALRSGLRQVGISDHGPANMFGVGVAGSHVFQAIRCEIKQVQQELEKESNQSLHVFLGVEANVISLDGTLDVAPEVLASLDYVMVGLHVPVRPASWTDAGRFAVANIAGRWFAGSAKWARQLNTDALIAAVRRHRVDVITHPGWRLNIDTPRLAAACAETGTALEVNTSHGHGGLAYVEAAAAAGVDFVVGSDAHQPERVGDLQVGLKLLEEADVPVERIRNAVVLDDRSVSKAGDEPVPVIRSYRR